MAREYGKSYIMGQMKKQGELNAAPPGLHREAMEKAIIGKIDREALNVNMPRKPDPKNKFDPAVFRLANQKDY